MLNLEEMIPGDLDMVSFANNRTLDRTDKLLFFKNKEVVNIKTSVFDGAYSKTIYVVDKKYVDEYFNNNCRGSVYGHDVDVRLAEVVDYFEHTLHIGVYDCSPGYTLSRSPVIYRGCDRCDNKVTIIEYIPNSQNDKAKGYLELSYVPSKLIFNKLKELLNDCVETKIRDVTFDIERYSNIDRLTIFWTTPKIQKSIDAACEYFTKVVIENL